MVEAKACHVINITECAQQYGANKATKMVQGIVTAVDIVQNANNNWMTTFITAAYDIGGITMKSSWLNVQVVKVVVTPVTSHSICGLTAHGKAAGSFDGDSTMMDNSTPNDTTPAVDAPMLDENAAGLVTLEVTVQLHHWS